MTETTRDIPQVILVGAEAAAYLAMRRHAEKIVTLMNAGVFELQSGNAQVNFNNGVIQNVFINQVTYKRKGASIETGGGAG